MKKTMIFTTLAATMMLAGGISVSAEKGETALDQVQTRDAKTKASINFKSENDQESQKPEGPYAGNLSLISAPAEEWNFGEGVKAPTGGPQTFARVKKPTAVGKQYIGIMDDRKDDNPNKPDGWTVTAQLDKMTNESTKKSGEATKEMTADVLFTMTNLYNVNIDKTILNDAGTDYEFDDLSEADDTVLELLSSVPTGLTINQFKAPTSVHAGGDPVVLATATKDAAEQKNFAIEVDNVQLKVISGAVAGQTFEGDLTWKLTNGWKTIGNGYTEN